MLRRAGEDTLTHSTLVMPVVLALAALALAGCAAKPAAAPAEPPVVGLARSDAQGAVQFVVTPLNLDTASATLDFDVSMNTHSIDLGWDLAAQSVLVTDSGLEMRGERWPAGSGHHYQGTLSFPAKVADGRAFLDGAATLTLVIRDTDVPERIFTWVLGP